MKNSASAVLQYGQKNVWNEFANMNAFIRGNSGLNKNFEEPAFIVNELILFQHME